MPAMTSRRAALGTILLASIGLAVSGVIDSVSRKLAASSGYTSFCNVSESVNCDVVLASSYARFLGVSVSRWALLAYLLFAAGGVFVLVAKRASQRRLAATALFWGASWSLAYSLFLAAVAIGVLHAVCLLCAGLYLVNTGLFLSSWFLLAAVRREAAPRAARARGRQTRAVVAGAAVLAGGFLLVAGWEAKRNPQALSASEIARLDPDFYRWYTALPVAAVDIPGGQPKGSPGDVVIVEFSDFECAHCAKAYRSLKRVLPRFGGDVQLRFHHFPLNADCNPAVDARIHPYACLAAVASECAAAQGRFWPYHDLLFENQSELDRPSLIEYAERAGLDRGAFVACLESEAARQAVLRDVAEGRRLGIASTPTFFLNGRAVAGALDPEKFENAIRLERAARQSSS
jgi:protein-disulfide isomerase/uncharacterized membrane protein